MIDVVIPVFRPDQRFYNLISGLANQSRQPDKIVLMLTMCERDINERQKLEDKCCNLLKEVDSTATLEVHTVSKNDFNHGRTRNRGVAYGRNPFIMCMTQDAAIANKNLIENMMEVLEMNPDISQVYARQMTDEKAPEYLKLTQNFNYPDQIIYKNKDSIPTMGIKTIFCSNVCCMYRRDVFEYLGGFEDKVIFNEDMIFARKAVNAGYTICYYGKNGVVHYHKYSLKQQFKRNFDLAVSQKMNSEVFSDLSSTSEGKKMVKTVLKKLTSDKKYGEAFYYFFLSAAKYMGYLMGKNYEKFSTSMCRKFSMNPDFWD